MSINYSAATMAILDTLGRDPETRYHVRAVAERAGVSAGAASMILRALADSELLTVEQTGNMKFYQYNLSNPVARQFKVLFNTSRLNPLADMLKEVAEQLVVFGSVAEGTDVRDSDVDLFVLAENENIVRERLAMFVRKHYYSQPLSPIIMDAAKFARLRREDPSLYQNILRGKVLWERS